VLDSYWPAVSILHHKKDLKVIQIWHAIGKLKKTGRVAAGEKGGRDKDTAELLNMHGNNDCIIAGSSVWNRYYCESFGCTEDMLYNYGLPRIDYLIDTEEENRKRFFEDHPELSDKPILLYAPTFRRGMESRWADIIDAVDTDKYHLIIKNHPKQKIEGKRPDKGVHYFDNIDSMQLLAVADYVITDYSAISLEAAVLDKKTLFWVYDYEEYIKNNGLNIDLFEAAPGHVSRDIKDIMKVIDDGSYDMSVLDRFRQTYLPDELGTSTQKITDMILHIIKTGNLPEKR
jgi:CDP-ribitol ribitolphosphotransferase